MNYYVTVNEEKLREVIAQKVAEHYNGKSINVSGGVGETWASWRPVKVVDGITYYEEVPGTRRLITAVTGTISATANGGSVDFVYNYNIQM